MNKTESEQKLNGGILEERRHGVRNVIISRDYIADQWKDGQLSILGNNFSENPIFNQTT